MQIRLRQDYISEAKQALVRLRRTQGDFAFDINVSRDTVSRFLNAKAIGYRNFQEISEALGLNWEEIAAFSDNSEQDVSSDERAYSDTATSLSLNDAVASNLPFYVERQPIESECYRAIVEPGALVRLKGPKKMGKTLLAKRLLALVRRDKFCTVFLSFNLADLRDTTTILQWLCATVSQQLNLPNEAGTEWSKLSTSSNQNATDYLNKVLNEIKSEKLILVLDDLDLVFGLPNTQDSLCRLFRYWNDISKDSAAWSKLRLLLVHSTDRYGQFDINHSPLAGVGTDFPLLEFSEDEISDLVKRHNITDINIADIKDYFGGHPFLVNRALTYLQRKKVSLKHLWDIADTEEAPFANHLREQLETLQKNSELATAFNKLLSDQKLTETDKFVGFKLLSMGLVKAENGSYVPLCKLYKRYFSSLL